MSLVRKFKVGDEVKLTHSEVIGKIEEVAKDDNPIIYGVRWVDGYFSYYYEDSLTMMAPLKLDINDWL